MAYEKVKYNNEYNRQAYDRLGIQVVKGRKEAIETHWKAKGYKSLNSYVNALIDADMEAGEGQNSELSNQEKASIKKGGGR